MHIDIEQATEAFLRELRMRAITRGELPSIEVFASLCEALEDAISNLDSHVTDAVTAGNLGELIDNWARHCGEDADAHLREQLRARNEQILKLKAKTLKLAGGKPAAMKVRKRKAR